MNATTSSESILLHTASVAGDTAPIKVSLFGAGYDPQTLSSITLETAVGTIMAPDALQLATERAHGAYATALKAHGNHKKAHSDPQYQKAKLQMPGFTSSGEFSYRKDTHLVQYSGLLCYDIDGLDDVARIKAAVKSDAFCVMAYTSPSGYGVKLFLRWADPRSGDHKRAWDAGRQHVESVYGVTITDTAGRDLSRLCLLAYDPDVFFNPAPSLVRVPAEPVREPLVSSAPAPEPESDEEVQILSALGYLDPDTSYEHWIRVGMALRRWNAERGFVFWDAWSARGSKYRKDTMRSKWESFAGDHNDPVTLGTIFHMAKERGWAGALADAILLPSGRTPITEAAAVIFEKFGQRGLAYSLHGAAVEVANDPWGVHELKMIDPQALRSRIELLGPTKGWIKTQRGEWHLNPKRPTGEDCKGLLASKEARGLLPPINSVRSSPVLMSGNSGPVLMKTGYNKEFGGVYVVSRDVPPVISLEEARGALADLLSDFAYATPADRTRHLAYILTPALHFGGFINDRIPIFVVEADKRQTGKGTAVEATVNIYAEQLSMTAKKKGGVGSFDESFGNALTKGRPFILIDNLRGLLDSEYLEAFITAPGLVSVRIPGKAEVEVDPRSYILSATSNGWQCTEDMAARACIIRLRHRPENYRFKYDLIHHIRSRGLYYLGCIHAIIRAWHANGSPMTDTTGHSFRHWVQITEGVIRRVWPDAAPLLEGHAEAQARTSDKGWDWLRRLCLAADEDSRLQQSLTATELAQICADHGIEIPGASDQDDARQLGQRIGNITKRLFGDKTGIQVDDYTVERRETTVPRPDGEGYFPSKAYVVRRTNP